MNKEEYRKHIEDEYIGTEYSYVNKENRNLEMYAHNLLVDIMTSEDSANCLIAMFPNNYGLPDHCLGECEVDALEDFESITIYSDILDDGEFHIIHDTDTDSWFFDRTYDFMDCVEDICKNLGMRIENAEIGSIDGWRRNKYANGCTLGLDDFITVLECVKIRNFNGLRDKIPLENALKKLEFWRNH